MTRVRVTDDQLVQALRDLGAVSSETAVTTRKVAQHLGERTSYVRERLDWMMYRKQPGHWMATRIIDGSGPVGWRSNGGPNYWWANEAAS